MNRTEDTFAAMINNDENNAKSSGQEKRCYTVEELQKILRCGRRTVYDLLKKNEFSYIKLMGAGYRISKRSFDEWLDRKVS